MNDCDELDLPGDDYLWDRRAPVDAEIAALERGLARYGWRARTAVAPTPALSLPEQAHRRRRRVLLASAAAVAALAICAGGWFWHRLQWPPAQPWPLTALSGPVRIDGHAAGDAAQLAPGSVLETGRGASVRLRAARIGELALGPDSRFSLVETRSGHHRVRLQRGRLWARVWAPPGSFGVDTAAAGVYDLGCEFVLETDAGGRGRLTVQSGWVAIESGVHEVLVPQGARVALRGDGAPGIPYDLGASADFVAALLELDRMGRGARADSAAVRRLLAAARPQDAISLLSLLKRYPHLARGPLFDRLATLMPADAGVTRASVRTRGAAALDPWWRALPYPRAKQWWLQWPDAFAGTAPPPQWRE